jgi:signal transduction histidine kinase
MLSSLTNRIFFASTLLATVSIGFAVYFVSSRLRAEAEADLRRDLTEAASLVDEQRAALLDTFTLTARLIADLPKLKAAIDSDDPPTVAPIARDYQEQVGSDLFRVIGPRGRVLADIGGSQSGVLQVVSVPVSIGLDTPDLLGTLTIGYLLDNERAASFKALTGADIAFAVDGQVRSSTFPAETYTTLADLLDSTLVSRTLIGDREYAALVRPLPAPAPPAGASTPVVIVLRSRTERMSTLSAIETGLGIVALATVLLAIAISYGVARTMTRPLARITDHMRQIAATGDLTRKLELPSRRWQDEDARVLASTFNTLTDSIVRFQKEAAQRERLSALGRLSTVIAHEVRNPLMIIKGALRQLTRDGATRADVGEAAADIDGEIERLNRVVNEVLDFARPIHFERAATDVNALCTAAAAAVTAAEAEPPVETELDASAPKIDTDGERLRTALVNLLTNARQAVLAHNGARERGAVPVVKLSTARLSDHRIVVSIADRGDGIAADDLPRIFDPYFTTRRAGTGLGLPIAKNIIDGLGGTITVASTPGRGTHIRIELGDAPVR